MELHGKLQVEITALIDVLQVFREFESMLVLSKSHRMKKEIQDKNSTITCPRVCIFRLCTLRDSLYTNREKRRGKREG